MSDDVGALFEELDRVPVPAGDLASVTREGGARRRRRAAVRVVSLSVVVLAAGVSTAILSGQEDRPVPATPDDRRFLGSRLVPLTMEGPVPGPELAPEEDRARARAVTVAFHGLLDRAPIYDFDYRGVERTADGWLVEFREASASREMERALTRLRAEIKTRQTQIEAQRSNIIDAVNELGARLREVGRGELRGAEQMHDELRERAVDLGQEVRRVEVQLARLEERLSELRRRHPALPVTLTVSERDGFVVVEDLLSESKDSAALKSVVGYAEAVDRVDAWGADYYGLEVRRVDDAAIRVHVRRFWTGPLFAPYEERCVPEVVNRGGEVVWTAAVSEAGYGSAPPTEELRDGEEIELGFEYGGDERDLSVGMLCRWRPRQ